MSTPPAINSATASPNTWTQGSLLTIDQAVEFARRGRGERRRPATGWDSLTATEKKVAALVADGRTNPEIATALIMGRATVKTHVSNILDKLGLANRTQIATESLRRERRKDARDHTYGGQTRARTSHP